MFNGKSIFTKKDKISKSGNRIPPSAHKGSPNPKTERGVAALF
jgi:hypothetical protein